LTEFVWAGIKSSSKKAPELASAPGSGSTAGAGSEHDGSAPPPSRLPTSGATPALGTLSDEEKVRDRARSDSLNASADQDDAGSEDAQADVRRPLLSAPGQPGDAGLEPSSSTPGEVQSLV
jgi:hypothetical protein